MLNTDIVSDRTAKIQLAAALQEKQRRISENKLLHYKPYKKQMKFHELGSTIRERLFMAGNQLGKTIAGTAEMAMHLTGLYPEWWQGRRYKRPVVAWASGITGDTVRDTVQRLLVGRTGE